MITAQDFADVERRSWVRRFEFHLDLIPKLLGALLELATPTVGVSRGGSRFDRPQITGGGFYDSIPTLPADQSAGVEASYLWALFADYATAVSEWLNARTVIPTTCPNTPRAAHDTALVIVATLIRHAAEIHQHRELDEFEEEMFREIRRLQRRHLPDHDGVPQHARDCRLCGAEKAVRAVCTDALDGSPDPVLIGRCRSCGQEYRNEGETSV